MSGPKLVAYLVNQYPAVSHTFIRREIAAVERDGAIEVIRYSLRRSADGFVDPADRAEAARTRIVADAGVVGSIVAMLGMALGAPRRFSLALVTAFETGWNSDRGLLRNLGYFVQACVLIRNLREARVEHLHAHFGTMAAAVAMLCRALGGPPYSFTIHGPLEFELARLLSLPQKIAHAEFVVAISHFCQSQIWRHSAAEHRDRIHVVTCGVDAAFFEKDPAPIPQASRLVFVGRLSAPKAPEVLLDAVARLHREGVVLDLTYVGDGEMRPQLEETIKREGLGDHVRIAGYSDEATVRKFISEARALVLPSFSEGLPVVLMEAFALGRPVISTYIAGIPELVESGKSGWLTAASALDELTAALREVAHAPVDKLAMMGRTGRAKVVDRHDVNKSGGILARLFLTGGSRAAASQNVNSPGISR